MASCSNCGKKLSCGCQKKKASNGTSVCNSCSAQYEKQLKLKNTIDKLTK